MMVFVYLITWNWLLWNGSNIGKNSIIGNIIFHDRFSWLVEILPDRPFRRFWPPKSAEWRFCATKKVTSRRILRVLNCERFRRVLPPASIASCLQVHVLESRFQRRNSLFIVIKQPRPTNRPVEQTNCQIYRHTHKQLNQGATESMNKAMGPGIECFALCFASTYYILGGMLKVCLVNSPNK